MISGPMTTALARAARRIIPPESSSGYLPSAPSSPTVRRILRTRSRISPSGRSVFSRSGNATFSKTVSESKSAPDWNSIPNRFRTS